MYPYCEFIHIVVGKFVRKTHRLSKLCSCALTIQNVIRLYRLSFSNHIFSYIGWQYAAFSSFIVKSNTEFYIQETRENGKNEHTTHTHTFSHSHLHSANTLSAFNLKSIRLNFYNEKKI